MKKGAIDRFSVQILSMAMNVKNETMCTLCFVRYHRNQAVTIAIKLSKAAAKIAACTPPRNNVGPPPLRAQNVVTACF